MSEAPDMTAPIPSNFDQPVTMTGGAALATMLQRHGVELLFGMGGFQLLPFYEAVRTMGLRHHLVDDERSGAFAADAAARITGRPGVCDATLGPGATNLVTALVESLNAGVPMVVIVGDAHRSHTGKNMTQEGRQTEILRPAAKAVIRVESFERIPELVRRAFSLATTGRPGPVVVAVPEDICHARGPLSSADLWVDDRVVRAPARRSRPDEADVEAAADLLAAAERPVVLAGGGVHISGAYDELAALSATFGIPVAHTLSGKGAVACCDDWSVGVFGRYSRFANELIEQADVALVVGCKLGEIATKRYTIPGPRTRIVHLDLDDDEIGRWARTSVGMLGDARLGLRDLAQALARRPDRPRSELRADIERHRQVWAQRAAELAKSDERPISIGRVFGELHRALPDDSVLVTDGGFASHWAGLLYDTKRAGRGVIADRGFASIGYGVPASVGAALAAPERFVVGVTGDGGFNMSVGALETAVRTGAAPTVVVLNNAASGYVKALQHAVYGAGSYQSSDLSNLDYAAVARAYGAQGIRVEEPDDLADALQLGLSTSDRPTVIDVVVTRDPSQMLPGVDSRTTAIEPGDRPA